MTISHRLSPGRKRRSVIEHFNTQDVSSFLLFHCRGNSAPKLIFISLTDTTSKQFWNPFGWAIACVASVSSRGSSRKLEREQKKNEWRGRGRGTKEPLVLPSPSPFNLFFCFRSNFRAITRLETLATQARWATPILFSSCMLEISRYGNHAAVSVLSSPYFCLRQSWYTKNYCLSFSKTSGSRSSVCPSLFCAIFFGIVLFICFRQLNEKD